MKKNKKYTLILLFFIILFCCLIQTMVYSAINSTMNIKGVAYARVEADVRITDFRLANAINATSFYEEFGKNHVVTNVNLTNSTSNITYYLEITNYGNVDVVISNITGLPEGISYSIKDYKLNDKICDDYGKCNNYAVQTYEITLTTNSSYDGNIQLNFEFKNIYSISYIGIKGSYPTTILHEDDLNIIIDSLPKFINVYENGIEKERNTYLYSNITGNLIIENVMGDLVIENGVSYIIDGQSFSKQLKDFVNSTTDATYKSEDYKIKYIGFYEDELPVGYTQDKLENLPYLIVSDDSKIKAYNDNGNIYVYSKNDIKPNETMYSMFREMKNLEEIDLSNLETSHVYSFASVFNGSSSLRNIDIRHWDTSNSDTFSCMFKNLPLLTNIDLSNFDTGEADRLDYMFYGDTGLVTLDLSNFNTQIATGIYNMFQGASNIEKIYIGDGWDMSKITNSNNMFDGCYKLPNYNHSYRDAVKAYAGPGGYLTHINASDLDNNINAIGGEVCLREECFYVVSHENTKVTMLAKHNLYVGGQYNVSTKTWTEYGSEVTGIQDPSMKAYEPTGSLYNGTIPFSNTNYWINTTETYPHNIYNSNSNLYTHLENYKSYLQTFNIIVNNSRLLTYDEVKNLGYTNESKFAKVPEWVYSSSYWLGSASSDELVYSISKYPALNERTFAYINSYGLRPVIEIEISEIYKIS